MNTVEYILKKQLSLSDEMYHRFVGLTENRYLKKKELFVEQGKVCAHLGIIERGVLRSYIEKDAEEFIKDFYFPGSFVVAYGSFLTGEPWVHLRPLKEDKRTVEIGWRLKRAAWGEGYVTEAARTMLAYAFKTVGFERVVAYTHVDNIRSPKVMERLRFRHVTDFIYDSSIPSSSYEIKMNEYIEISL